jgi:uncharacterized protein YndB with AHSA1/START domain
MSIDLRAEWRFSAAPEAVFDLCVDPARFPQTFTGYGPIPAIRQISLDGPLRTGAQRRIHNSDGSVLDERVTLLERPHRHGYELSGFRAPFAWLVTLGRADWQIEAADDGTRVTWLYRFTPRSAVVRPFSWLLLRGFLQPAMRRCLRNMDRLLASAQHN